MSRTLIIAAACAAAFAVTGCATSQEEAKAPPVIYTVVEADAAISFASSAIRNYRVGKDADRSLLLESTGNRWYRATLQEGCRRSLPWQNTIGYDTDTIDRLDRFSTIVIDGHRCAIRALDRIADPDVALAATPAS